MKQNSSQQPSTECYCSTEDSASCVCFFAHRVLGVVGVAVLVKYFILRLIVKATALKNNWLDIVNSSDFTTHHVTSDYEIYQDGG